MSEASGLQDDLRRARIEPFAEVVNRSLAASATQDPVLAARLAGEAAQLARVTGGLGEAEPRRALGATGLLSASMR